MGNPATSLQLGLMEIDALAQFGGPDGPWLVLLLQTPNALPAKVPVAESSRLGLCLL